MRSVKLVSKMSQIKHYGLDTLYAVVNIILIKKSFSSF